jgi:mitofusin
MAQTYYPTRIASPVKQAFHESVFGSLHGDKHVEDIQEAYVESKDR